MSQQVHLHLAVSPGVSRGPTVEFSDRSASVSRDAPAPVDRRSLATSLDRWAADGPAESCIEPICIETKCTTATHCSAHAGSVTSDVAKTACTCTCSTGLTGATCNACDVGYINYGTCTECTTATHCSAYAGSVTSGAAKTACVCTCRPKWRGASCQIRGTNTSTSTLTETFAFFQATAGLSATTS